MQNIDRLSDSQLEDLILSLPRDSRRRIELEAELNRRIDTRNIWSEDRF